MMHDARDLPLRYYIFILSMWEEGASQPGQPARWRYTLEHGQSGGRRGFKTLATLVAYLDSWTHNPPDGAAFVTSHTTTEQD